MYLVDEDTVIISEFKPGSNPTAIQITDAAVPYMEGLGFEVYRPWAWNVGSTHYTYTNAFRVNDRIFIPSYWKGNSSYLDEDTDALAKWQAAASPSVEIIPIDSYNIIPAAGALHCILKQGAALHRYDASGMRDLARRRATAYERHDADHFLGSHRHQERRHPAGRPLLLPRWRRRLKVHRHHDRHRLLRLDRP